VLGELSAARLPARASVRSRYFLELCAPRFSRRQDALVLGEPLPWLARLFQALSVAARATAPRRPTARRGPGAGIGGGRHHRRRAVRWIADADSRTGPVCEAIVDGRYYWCPSSGSARSRLEAPADLRDVVWMPAKLGSPTAARPPAA